MNGGMGRIASRKILVGLFTIRFSIDERFLVRNFFAPARMSQGEQTARIATKNGEFWMFQQLRRMNLISLFPFKKNSNWLRYPVKQFHGLSANGCMSSRLVVSCESGVKSIQLTNTSR